MKKKKRNKKLASITSIKKPNNITTQKTTTIATNQTISIRQDYAFPALLKLSFLLLMVVIIGLPINTIFDFSLLTISIIFVITTSIKSAPKEWLIAFLVVVLLRLTLWLIPDLEIQEGHNYFTYKDRGEVLEKTLPKDVFIFAKKMLQVQYPLKGRVCEDKEYCWGYSTIKHKVPNYPGPKTTFAFSGDAVFQDAKYSRVVDSIDFDNQNSQRADFLNTSNINWYWFGNPKIDGIIPRTKVPQFVLYEFPKQAIGGKLCWQGYLMWQQDNSFKPLLNKTKKCQTLNTKDIGKQIYGFSILHNLPLQIEFKPPTRAYVWQIIEDVLKILTIAYLLVLLLARNWQVKKEWYQFGIFSITTLIIAAILNHNDIYSQLIFRVHQAGNDGLTHISFGRVMLEQLLSGNIVEFLRGGIDVFYYMPGLRYFRSLEQVIFGSTNFGYILLLFFMALFLWKFINIFFKNRIFSLSLLAIFVLTPWLEVFGFSFEFYQQIMFAGFPGTAAYSFLLMGLYLIFNYFDDKHRFVYFAYWAGLTLALAAFMRPNLALMLTALLLGLFVLLIYQKRYKEILIFGSGFAFILLVPLHNIYFGSRFVALTDAAFIKANFITSPSVYWQALINFLNGETTNITQHAQFRWRWWAQGSYDFLRFDAMFPAGVNIFLHLTIFITTLIGLFYRKLNLAPQLKIFILAIFIQHISMFMWRPSYRYSAIIWLLTFIIAILISKQFYYLKFSKKR